MATTKKQPSAKNNWGFTEEVMAKRRRAIADPVRQQILDVMIRGNQDDWTARELAAEGSRYGQLGQRPTLVEQQESRALASAGSA